MSLSCSATRPPWLYPLPKLEKLLRSRQHPPLQLPLLSLADSRNGCSLVDDVLSRILEEIFPPPSPQGGGRDGGGDGGSWGGEGGGGERSVGAAKPSPFEMELAKTHLAVDLQKLFGQWCRIGLEKTLSGSPLRDLLVPDLQLQQQQQQQQMIDTSKEFGASSTLAAVAVGTEEGIQTCGGGGGLVRKRGVEHQDGDTELDEQGRTKARKVRHYGDAFICPYYERDPQDQLHKGCGQKGFPNPRKLKEHIWRFTKPFICPTCGEGFGREKTKAIHCEQRKIKCKQTDKADVYQNSAERRRDRGVEAAKSTSEMVRVFEEYDREKAFGPTLNHLPLNPQYDEGEEKGEGGEAISESTSPSTSSSSPSESCFLPDIPMVGVDQKPNLLHLPAAVYPEQIQQYIPTPPHSHTTSFPGSPDERPTEPLLNPQQGMYTQQYPTPFNNSGNNNLRRNSDVIIFGLFPDAGQADTYSMGNEPLQRPRSAPPSEHYSPNFEFFQQFHQREIHTRQQQEDDEEGGEDDDDDEEAENRFQPAGPVPRIKITTCSQNSRPAYYTASPTTITGDSMNTIEPMMQNFRNGDEDFFYAASSSTTGSAFQTTVELGAGEVGLEERVGGINIHQQSSPISPSASSSYQNIANNTNSPFSNINTTGPYINHHHHLQQQQQPLNSRRRQQQQQQDSTLLQSDGYRSFPPGTFGMKGFGVSW